MQLPVRTAPCRRLRAFVFLALVTAIYAQSPECKRKSDNKDEPPDFICFVDVTFIRQDDCSARVTERFLFPHTSGEPGWRAIRALDDVLDVELFRDDKELPFVTETGNNEEFRVQMTTEENPEPVLFVLSYTLAKAVNRFTEKCESNADPDESKNVLRWSSGEWMLSFDVLSVTFQTENKDAKFTVLGDDNAASGSTDQKVTIKRTNVDDNVELYVSESDVEVCPVDLRCFPTGFNEIPLIIALCVIGLLVLGVIIWCAVRCRATHKKVQDGNDVVGDIEDP